MTYWLFQGNPKYYRVKEALRDFERLPWSVTNFKDEIHPGDGVLIWISGHEAGIYAIAEVLEAPKKWKNIPDSGYWLESSQFIDKPFALIRLTTKLLDKPLLKIQLLEDPILQDLSVIKMAQRTNFKVTPEQWKRIYEIKEK